MSSQAGHPLQRSNQCQGKVSPHHQISGYWRVIHIIILSVQGWQKFLPEVCRAIQNEFTREYLRCSTTPDEWKELEREFRIRWNVPHALGALDGKHVALKIPKNSGALYHNYKGFFSVVMLALVDGQYKFRWVNASIAGSCSDAQIFNACQLKRKIDDGRMGW